MRKFGDWAKVARISATMKARFQASVRRALLREAHLWRAKMIETITQGTGFAPLSPMTLALRAARGFGGSKPLIVTGALRRSITVVQERGGAIFVGVHRQAKGHAGKSMVDIASIHEFGRSWTQNLSPKARRYLFAMMREAGMGKHGPRLPARGAASSSGTISIHIPARPFIRPTIAKHGKPADVRRRFVDNVLQGMGGDFRALGGA